MNASGDNGNGNESRKEVHKTAQPAWERDVLVPAGQSALIGVGVLTGGLAIAVPLVIWRGWAWWLAPLTALILGLLAFAVATVLLTLDHRRLLWAFEQVLQVDINRDNHIGQPAKPWEKQMEPGLVYVRDPQHYQRQQAAANFRFFLRAAYDGRGTTWRAWSGTRMPDGQEMTQPLWERYINRLESAGLGYRQYQTAPLTLVGDFRTALMTFREVL